MSIPLSIRPAQPLFRRGAKERGFADHGLGGLAAGATTSSGHQVAGAVQLYRQYTGSASGSWYSTLSLIIVRQISCTFGRCV